MRRSLFRLCIAGFALVSSPGFALEATGQFGGAMVVDGIAIRTDDGTELVFSDVPFDRAALAADFRFDISDRDFHETTLQGSLVTLRLDADGTVSGLGLGGSSMYSSDMDAALTLDKRSAQAIAGRFEMDQFQLKFDLPLWTDGAIPRVGTPLPADGGEAGKVLQSYLSAIESGDYEVFVALSPPSWRESLQASKAKGEAQLELDAVREELPESITPVGGHGESQRAWIDLDAKRDGAAVKAVATMEQDAAGWYVRRIVVLR
jgi:hypothetical protein